MADRMNVRGLMALLAAVFLVAGCEAGQVAPQNSAATASAAAPLPTPTATPAETGDYLLNPGDILEISVWKEVGMEKEVLVLPDGMIAFPLVGFIKAAGRSASDIQKELTTRITKYIPYPVVTVSIRQVAGNSVYVIGHVAKPGEFQTTRRIDVLQALSLAGGLTVQASEPQIKIIRRENGRENVYVFDYSQIKKGIGLENNILLKSGDVVVVPGGYWQ